jgi:serine/threonine protein kinase
MVYQISARWKILFPALRVGQTGPLACRYRDDMGAPARLPGAIAGYRLDKSLGQGSMAAVYLATDERLHRPVALKVLTPDSDRDPAVRARILREARAAATIGHPHILPVYAADEADGTVYMVMRYARGGDARSLIGRLGPLPPGYAWRIIAQIASALDAAHAHGLIHRDVRPANILLDAGDRPAAPGPAGPGPAGPGAARDTSARHARAGQAAAELEPDHAYLADFGLGPVFPPGQITAADQVTGTLDYLAPEQIEGRALDGRADLYALACTAFELLCGMPPFGPDQGMTLMYAQLYAPPPPASGRRPMLPVAVDSVLGTALAKNPDDRYPSCGRFARELRAALELGPDAATAPPRPRPRSALTAGRATSARQPAAGTREPATSAHQPSIGTREPAVGVRPPGAGRQMLVAGRRYFAEVGKRPPGDRPAVVEERPAAGPVQLGGDAIGHPDRRDLGPHAPRGRALRPVLAAAAMVAVIVAVVYGVALSKRSTHDQPTASGRSSSASQGPGTSQPPGVSSAAGASTAPSPAQADQLPAQAAQQAAALGTLLTSSAAARTALHQAVTLVSTCANLPGAVRQLQSVVTQRSGEYDRASALTISALPGGPAVKSGLLTALSRSLTADQEYLTWARQQLAGGCTPGSQSGAYNAAFSASQRADAAKQAFVQAWNPLAAKYGIKPSSAGDI